MAPTNGSENAEIERGLGILTWVIENHSEAAWPLFDRLERGLQQRRTRRSRLDRHRQTLT